MLPLVLPIEGRLEKEVKVFADSQVLQTRG